jgi:RNA polymerase sigma-70 factor (ECF subfamily)
VQYRETDLNFISRLMEQEGIYYCFLHKEDEHVLVLADSVQHIAADAVDAKSPDQTYMNSFTCIPAKVPFRPARVTPKPAIHGVQTAVVVGPGTSEIHTKEIGFARGTGRNRPDFCKLSGRWESNIRDMESPAALMTPEPAQDGGDDERSLIARLQAGDAGALEVLVAEHQARVARLVYRLLGKADEVDDAVQEVFLAALQNLRRFRGHSRLSTWLTAIALNRCRSRARRRPRWLRLLPWRADAMEMPAGGDRLGEAAEIHDRVRQAVYRLPAKYREVIVLRYFEDLPSCEIAAALGLSSGAVDVRLSRARQRLKEMLSNWWKEQWA